MYRDGRDRSWDSHVISLGRIDFLVGEEISPGHAVFAGEDAGYCTFVGLELGCDEEGGTDHELFVVGVEGRVVELVEEGSDRWTRPISGATTVSQTTYAPVEVASAKRVSQYGRSEYLALIAVILASRTVSHR